jgi:hypothetical protein
MLPYFFKLNNKLISDQLSEMLVSFSLNSVEKFTEHISDAGIPDGNNYLHSKKLEEIPEIKKLKDSCFLDFYTILYMHKPNSRVVKHIDNPKYRKSNIIHPLFPKTEYATTHFWKGENQVAVCDFSDNLPVVLNLNEYHSLENSDTYRINLQFSFKENFETVVKL